MTDEEFLNFIADRLIRFGDNKNVDFIIKLRKIAMELK